MKSILFDSSTLISMAISCSLNPIMKLQSDFGGDFAITPTVKSETIDKALSTLRFKYEGYRLNSFMKNNVLKLYPENKFKNEIQDMQELMNRTFFARDKALKIMHPGEVSALVVALEQGADAYAVDERTTRLLVESPEEVGKLLSSKLHTSIDIDKSNLGELKRKLHGLPIVRSTELAVAAYHKGYFELRGRDILEGILWALKFSGCAIRKDEINAYLKKA